MGVWRSLSLGFLLLTVSGCLEAGPSSQPTAGIGPERDGSGHDGQGPVVAPSGNAAGKRPLDSENVTATGEVVNATVVVRNNMAQDAFLFIGFRPLSLVEEAPCNLVNLHIPAESSLEIDCRVQVLSDRLLVAGIEWFDHADSSVAHATARHASDLGDSRHVRLLAEIRPGTAVFLERVS